MGRVTRTYGSHGDRNAHKGALRALAELVSRQHGVVSLAQLRGLGFGDSWIRRRIAAGYLIRIHRGVYTVGRRDLSRKGRWMAAVLTCGYGALLSHRSAAAHWGLLATAAARIDVSLPSHRAVRGREGVWIHRVRLDQPDRTLRDAIPITTPMRTLLDLGDVATASRVRQAYEQSLRLGLFDRNKVDALIARSPGRRGLRPLCSLLAEGHDEPSILRSKLERRFLELCRAHALPLPATNAVVEGFEVDAVWPRARLVVELDSYAHHRGREAFEGDRQRDQRLALAGYRVLRFTDRRLRRDPNGVAAALRRMLGL